MSRIEVGGGGPGGGGGSGTSSASDVTYDNTDSGLSGTDVQAAVDELAASGGGGSPRMSTSKFVVVEANLSTPVLVAHGGTSDNISFTGATLTLGEDFYGDPGTALPLPVTVSGSGFLRLPDEDRLYDIVGKIVLACDLADVGKMVGVEVNDPNAITFSTWSVVVNGGEAEIGFALPVRTFIGDGSVGHLQMYIYADRLTADAHITECKLWITER